VHWHLNLLLALGIQRAFILCRAAVVVLDPHLHRRGATADSGQLAGQADGLGRLGAWRDG
jgi:hypothetical protein